MPLMHLDFSTFSLCHALGSLSPWYSSATTTMPPLSTVAPQEPPCAERETCPPSDQQNQYDVDITSYSTHSLNPTPRHENFILQHSFSRTTPQDCVLPYPFSTYNTSPPHDYQGISLQNISSFNARITLPQSQQPDPSAEIASGLKGRPTSQNQPSDAVNPITYSASPLSYLDHHGNYQDSFSDFHLTTDHIVPIESIPISYSPVEQGSFQLNGQEGQQSAVTHVGSGRQSQPSHAIRPSARLPLHSSLAVSPRPSNPRKRARASSDADVVERSTTTNDHRPASKPSFECAALTPHAPRPSTHPRVQPTNVVPRMGLPYTVPRKMQCDSRMVDECSVENAIKRERPLLHVYECKWGKNHLSCGMYIEGDQSSVTDHLLRFHDFTGGEENTSCLWDGCNSKKSKAMKGTSIARHLVTHIGYKVQCTACNTVFAREDACRRSHNNARSQCRTMQMNSVHGPGVVELEVKNCKPVTKRRRL